MFPWRPRLAAAAVLVLAHPGLVAQCLTSWHTNTSVPGTDGGVYATQLWDPDGTGPATPVVVVGGTFRAAGPILASNIAAWDPAADAWSALGTGLDGMVMTLGVMPNGDLVAGGDFVFAGSVLVAHIARWNGIAWSALGTGTDSRVEEMAVMPNGDLVVGGWFAFAGGVQAAHVARWDGVSWHNLGTGTNSTVLSVVARSNGDVFVGGQFTVAGGVSAPFVARWDGQAWSSLGLGMNGSVFDLTIDGNGDVVAVGPFTTADGNGVQHVAKWNGAGWSPVGAGLDGTVVLVTNLPNGQLVAGGLITSSGGTPLQNLAAWNGQGWTQLAPGLPGTGPQSLTVLANGDFVAGGTFSSGTPLFTSVARWNGTAWSRLGPQLSSFTLSSGPTDMIVDAAGNLVVVGNFLNAGGLPIRGIARWNGSSWSGFGSGTASTSDVLFGVVEMPNGDLVVAGAFAAIGGVAASNVARWDGAAWHPVGSGTNGTVLAIALMPNGDVVAGGFFSSAGGVAANRVARWNGSAWAPLGSGPGGPPGGSQAVRALLPLPNGDLIAGGDLNVPGGANVARWSGTSWVAFGSLDSVLDLRRTQSGDILAGAYFPFGGTTGTVKRWNGTAWVAHTAPLVGTRVNCVFELPNGDLLAAGRFTQAGAVPATNIARWNGTAWSALGTGIGSSFGLSFASMVLRSGTVVVGGDFTVVDSSPASNLAELASTCPGSIVHAGNGCPSSGGNNVLAAVTPPWLGVTFHTQATGVPALGLAAVLNGLTSLPQGSLPLSTLFPQGAVGCDVLVYPDILLYEPILGGRVDSGLVLPSTLPLLGITFHQQMIPLDGTAIANGAITATNALRITVGVF